MPVVTDHALPLPVQSAEGRVCVLEQGLGHFAACRRDRCAFWEEGGAIIRPGCALSRIPLDLERAGLADLLLGLRCRIEQSRSTEDARAARRELTQVITSAFDDDPD